MKLLIFPFCLSLASVTPAAAQVTGSSVDGPRVDVSATGALLNITVDGRSSARPDIATFSAGVVTQAGTAGAAMSANAARMDAVVDGLKRHGIAERDIQTSSLSLQPQYVYPPPPRPVRQADGAVDTEPSKPQTPRIVGYEARNSVSVRVRRIEGMGRIVDALVAAGANQVEGPYFTLETPDRASDEARVAAMRMARHRADLYAREAGYRRARLISVSEGGGYFPVTQQVVVTGFQGGGAGAPPPPPPPPAPVQPGEVGIGISLTAQFLLEP